MTKKIFLFVFITIIGTFFSFYKLQQLYGFEFDQERDYYIVKDIVNGKPTLIGPRVVSSAGFYLGPWYYYLQVPFFVFFAGNPLYGAFFTGTVNFVIYLLLYFVLFRLSSSRLISLSAAILWVSTANRSNWNVSFVPFFFLIFLHLYFLIQKQRKFLFLLLLTLTFFLSLNFHPQMIFLVPVWLYTLTKYSLNRKQITYLVAVTVITVAPLIFFDLRHDFINSRAALSFLTTSNQKNILVDPFRFNYSLRQFSTSMAILYPGFQHNIPLTIVLLIFSGLVILRHRRYFIFWLLPVTSIILLAFYREPTWPEYYHLLGGFSLFILVFLIAVKSPVTKFSLLLLAVYLVMNNVRWLISRVEPGSYFYKHQMISYMLWENQPYDKLNIENDFRYGEGLGFSPIRQFYEKATGEYHPKLIFYVSYADSPKHNQTKKVFGLYAISKLSK